MAIFEAGEILLDFLKTGSIIGLGLPSLHAGTGKPYVRICKAEILKFFS
jgi:hypothetical protein